VRRFVPVLVVLLLWSSDDSGLASLLKVTATQSELGVTWLLGVADPLYRLIETHEHSSSGLVTLYAEYWTASVAAIVLAAALLYSLIPAAFSIVEQSSWQLVRRRYRKGEAAAKRTMPSSHIPRSAVSNYDRPTDATRQERRDRRRALSYRQPTPLPILRRWARFEYLQHRALHIAFNALRGLGAAFPRYPNLRTALRPAVIVLATVTTLVNRPLPHQQAWAQEAASNAWRWVTSPVPARLFPFAALLLGVLLLVRSTPLVDHIRARDEAAKEANRLLGQLYARLERLSLALDFWQEEFANHREQMLETWVNNVTAGRYIWHYGGGVMASDTPDWYPTSRWESHYDPEPLLQALADLTTIEDSVQDSGFERVAIRLTSRVYDSMQELDILRGQFRRVTSPTRGAADHRLPLPADIQAIFAHRPHDLLYWRDATAGLVGSHALPIGNQVSVAITEDASEKEQIRLRHKREVELENQAFQRLETADTHLAKLLLKQIHLHRIEYYLRRRSQGSAVTRSLAAIQK
jgi:hypothetical protein